jgi:hypothetical protein
MSGSRISRPSFALAIALCGIGSSSLYAEETAPPVIEAPDAASSEATSSRPAVVSGPLKRSDVLLSPRFYRADWLEALQAFSANRIVWTYAGDRLVNEAAAFGVPVQCTLPVWVPKEAPDRDAMACVDPSGTARVAGASTAVFPDPNSEAWRSYTLQEAEELVAAGCTSFHQDGAWLDFRSDLSRKGCYSSESREDFEAFVARGQSEDQTSPQIGEAEEADEAAVGAVDVPSEARAAFQKESLASYFEWLHRSVEESASSVAPDIDVTFSGNIGYSLLTDPNSSWLLPEFDFVLTEAFGNRTTMPNVLRDLARKVSSLRDISGVTFPRDDVWLNQRSIASAYALGLAVIAPWDVFVVNKPRYSGNPEDYAPFFEMVRNNQPLFDDYVAGDDFFGSYGPVMPGEGTVLKVDRSYAGRTTVSWSRARSFRNIDKGEALLIGGMGYKTTGPSTVGAFYLPSDIDVAIGDPLYLSDGANSYLISIRRNVRDPNKSAVHAVSWAAKPTALYLHLRRSDFPTPPTMVVTPKNPTPTPIEPRSIGNYYIYPVGGATWAILY